MLIDTRNIARAAVASHSQLGGCGQPISNSAGIPHGRDTLNQAKLAPNRHPKCSPGHYVTLHERVPAASIRIAIV
jgi:hypothetical protein